MCEGVNSNDFAHHCSEMQTWWDDVKAIRIKQNKRHLNDDEVFRWFFTGGSEVEDLFDDENCREKYKILCKELLSDRNQTVLNVIMNKIFNNAA